MNAIGYLRISTEGQAEGMGLDVQRQQVEDYCAAHGHALVAIHTDETSGSNGLAERVGMGEVLDALAVGDAELVVVPKLDRLARDLVVQEQLLAEIWRHGADIASCAEGEANLRDDPEDPSRRLIRQVLGAVSEYERAMIALRMRRGRMAKAAKGGFATGSPPFGWRADGRGGLEEVPEEQETIALMETMRKDGMSYQAIADQLNFQKRRTKRGKGYRWHPRPVKRVLDRREAQSSAAEAASSRRDEVRT